MRERKLNRLRGYDYTQPGAYFITICVKNRENIFGEINGGEMRLNEYGNIVNQQWQWLFKQYQYLQMDEFTVMPNHFHGIIHIVVRNGTVGNGRVGNGRDRSLHDRSLHDRSLHDRSLHVQRIKPIPQIIGAFKTTSSKLIHLSGNVDFAWQKSYHDHIIRNDMELQRIQKYILENLLNWKADDCYV